MISVQNISKQFGSIQAVKDISFDIQPGEVVGFLGPNGAGKSTTLRMITGFITPTSGVITIDGKDIQKQPVEAKQKIGYLPESAAVYHEMVVTDYLVFIGRLRGLGGNSLKLALQSVMQRCQLKAVMNRKIGDLSKGYRQRVGLAQALLHNPQILILDEPTVGLDPNQIAEIRELICEIGKTKTILLSTHILSEVVATCQRVMIVNNGRIVAQGTPQALMQGSDQEASYRVALRGDLKQIEERLKSLPGFIATDVNLSEGNLHRMIVRVKNKDDLSESIYDLAVNNHFKLAELQREQKSLESVFKTLTQ